MNAQLPTLAKARTSFTDTPAFGGLLQRKCACGNHTLAGSECEECRDKDEALLQRTVVNSERVQKVPPIVHEVLRSPGQPLDPETRAFFEPRFGHDFSQVRVHTDAKAAESARTVNALAYTVGRNVVMGAGRYTLGTTVGRSLLAHELAHVVQQDHQDILRDADLRVGSVGNTYEHEADAIANQVVKEPAAAHRVTTVLQRSPQPVIMRATIFTSPIEICRRVLRSRVFRVSQGGMIVTANARWEASAEWAGTERPECGRNIYHMTLMKQGVIFDSQYGDCEFAMGAPFSRRWTNLPEGNYYLDIWTNNTNPNCCLRGDIEVSQESGLSGETCTRPPPGPLEILHDALAIAGLIPALGAVPDAIDAGIYVIQGDWGNAGLSAAAMIPIFGDAAALGRIGARTVLRVEGRAIRRIGRDRIARGIREARAPVRAVIRSIPQGFTERQFERFSRGARRLRRGADLPDGELVVHGSRVTGTARTTPRPDLGLDVSDIDVALRVDDATFFNLAERVLARARPGTRLRNTMLDRIRRNGQLSSFDLGPEFQRLRRELLDSESPFPVQFSVLRRGGRLDTGPFLPLE